MPYYDNGLTVKDSRDDSLVGKQFRCKETMEIVKITSASYYSFGTVVTVSKTISLADLKEHYFELKKEE